MPLELFSSRDAEEEENDDDNNDEDVTIWLNACSWVTNAFYDGHIHNLLQKSGRRRRDYFLVMQEKYLLSVMNQ